MVARTRLSRVLQTLALDLGAALIIAYFAFHGYHGDHGVIARRAFELDIVNLTVERDALRVDRLEWEQRIGLLRADSLDPDLLEELARSELGFARANDLVHFHRLP
jgi:cell division protein FtsB